MKERVNAYKRFEKLVKKNNETLLRAYHSRIEKAREGFKEKVHIVFLQKFAYPAHQRVQQDLGMHSHFLFEIKDELENDKNKEYDSLFNQKFETIDITRQKGLLEKLAKLQALNDFFEYLRAKENEDEKEKSDKKLSQSFQNVNIVWKGKIELEFIQLIYGLYEAGYLSNEKNEITTLVKDIAAVFNLKLGNNWQSNLSKSVNNRKPNYKSEIFKKIESAFENYRDKQINKDKKI